MKNLISPFISLSLIMTCLSYAYTHAEEHHDRVTDRKIYHLAYTPDEAKNFGIQAFQEEAWNQFIDKNRLKKKFLATRRNFDRAVNTVFITTVVGGVVFLSPLVGTIGAVGVVSNHLQSKEFERFVRKMPISDVTIDPQALEHLDQQKNASCQSWGAAKASLTQQTTKIHLVQISEEDVRDQKVYLSGRMVQFEEANDLHLFEQKAYVFDSEIQCMNSGFSRQFGLNSLMNR